MSFFDFVDFNLHPRLIKAVEKQGFEQPTPIQEEAIPAAVAGKDVQACAETGSGKTIAYLLPLQDRLLKNKAPNSATRALILVPTRELARQVMKHSKNLTEMNDLSAGILTGGDDFKYQAAMLRKNPEIIVATPGRLVDHLKRNTIDLRDLEVLVLDEADRMLDMGFAEDMQTIANACNPAHQTLMFSATLKHQGVGKFAKSLMHDPVEITTESIQNQHSAITHQYILSDEAEHKDRLIAWLLANETYDKAIIFSNTRENAIRLSNFAISHNHKAAVLHGEMSQDERNHVMTLFRNNKVNVLVATDLAGRGLDIQGVDLVVNYEMARKGDDYVHRVGRTGRAGNTGTAISLISSHEWNLKAIIEKYLKQRFDSRVIKELRANYKGPKKVKASGKAATSGKRKKPSDKNNQKGRNKPVGKRPSDKAAPQKSSNKTSKDPWKKSALMDGDGFAPIKKNKK